LQGPHVSHLELGSQSVHQIEGRVVAKRKKFP
jgi:hypothetical protein